MVRTGRTLGRLRAFNRAHLRSYASKECHGLLVEAGFADVALERYKINSL
jgi:hypothetical protein